MKHLRKFNEGLYKDQLKDYCETYLAYLMDEGFDLTWSRIYSDDLNSESEDESWLISIRKPIDRYNYEIFRWGDVKDQIIRFSYLIDKEYELQSFSGLFGGQKKFRLLLPKEVRQKLNGPRKITTPTKDFSLEELEDLDDDFLLSSFSLKVISKL